MRACMHRDHKIMKKLLCVECGQVTYSFSSPNMSTPRASPASHSKFKTLQSNFIPTDKKQVTYSFSNPKMSTAAALLKRYEMWAPTGPCPIVPPNCSDNPGWVETRPNVPAQPWITGIDSPIIICLIAFQCVTICVTAMWFCIRVERARTLTSTSTPLQMSLLTKSDSSRLRDLSSPLLLSEEGDTKQVGIKMVGLRSDLFGNLAWFLCTCWGLLLAVAYAISLYGVYYDCQFIFPEALCVMGDFRIMGDYTESLNMQFAISVITVVVFGTYIFVSNKRLHVFHSTCELKYAELVKVSKTTRYQEGKNTSTKDPPISFLAPYLRCYNSLCSRKQADLVSKYKETCKVGRERDGSRYITFQGERYVWSEALQTFATKSVDAFRSHTAKEGLSSKDAASLQMSRVGPNKIDFQVQSLFAVIASEFTSFLYLYQVSMYAWWMYNTYWQVASVFFIVILVSGLTKACLKHRAQIQVYNMTRLTQTVNVLRDGEWKSFNSSALVPGDVLRLTPELTPTGWKIPADMVLFSGHTVCDESGLTGEPMPVHKTRIEKIPEATNGPSINDAVRRNSFADNLRVQNSWVSHDIPNLSDDEEAPMYNINPGHMLFAGCTVSQIGKNDELNPSQPVEEAHALVLRTGITTARGELIQEILYALPVSFQWDTDLGPVFLLLMVCGIVYGIVGVILQLQNGSDIPTWITSVDTFVWSLSQLLSPAIPLALIVGQISSTNRLREHNAIKVKDPKRIAMAGKVQTMCFDKTGTITKDGLDFIGVHSRGSKSEAFVSDVSLVRPEIVYGLATCHSLATFGGNFVGHQVEVEMFKASQFNLWTYDKKTVVKKGGCELHVHKIFKFDHNRMTMSVITEDVRSKTTFAYVKGAPENLLKLCNKATIPDDVDQVVAKYALDGYYVLALARKPYSMKQAPDNERNSDNRNAVESNLNFLGLLLFRNEVKADSPEVFANLNSANIECIMVTGDNGMCGSFVGRQCGILNKENECFMARYDTNSKQFTWTNLSSSTSQEVLNTANVVALAKSGRASIALSGEAFEHLCKTKQIGAYLDLVKIYSRMSPDNKQTLVDMLMDTGRIVGMCGDGGNDCGALRAAHVGLALSNSDASIVAPFTTTDKSLMSVVNLLREGRCALANSFSSYKFLILYGQIFALVKVLGQVYGCLISALGYFVIDGAMVIGFSSAISNSYPNKRLGRTTPSASLFSPATVISIIQFHLVTLVTFLITVFWLTHDEGYVAHPAEYTSAWQFWLLTDAYEQALMFTVFGIRMCSAGIAFSLGGSFRDSILKNWNVLSLVVLFYAFFSWLWLSGENIVTRWFHMASENFNRPDTDRYTWIMYHQDDPGRASSSGGITLGTRIGIWILISLSVPISVFLEHRASKIHDSERPKTKY